MLSKLHKQSGAMLVITAVLLPFLFAGTGLAVDMGNLYYHKARLQNSVDAAALAAGHAYADTKGDTNAAKNTAVRYLDINHGENSYTLNGITYRTPADSATRLTVEATETVPLYFLKLFRSQPVQNVSAKATAQIAKQGGKVPKIFEYAMIGGYDGKPPADKSMGGLNDIRNALVFHTADIDIKGKVHSNGSIYLDDTFQDKNSRTYFITSSSLSVTAKKDADLWANYRDNYYEHYLNGQDSTWSNGKQTYYADDDLSHVDPAHTHDDKIATNESWGRGFTWRYYYRMGTADKQDYTAQDTASSPIDISLSKTNDMTSSLYDLIETYRNMSLAEREKAHVYIDTDGNYSGNFTGYRGYQLNPSHTTNIYPGLTCGDFQTTYSSSESYKVWDNVYKIVIVDGDLSVNIPANQKPDNDNDHLILISLHGNISLQGSSPFHGFLYAPNGTVLIDGRADADIAGSIVAKSIFMTTGGQRISASNRTFTSDGSSSELSGTYVVSLVSDD